MNKFKFENNVIICGTISGNLSIIPLKAVQYITIYGDEITFGMTNGKTLNFEIPRNNDKEFKIIESITTAFVDQFKTTSNDLLTL